MRINIVVGLINNKGYHIRSDEFPKTLVEPDIPDVPCPSCGEGNLVLRMGNSTFVGCNHYPYCKHTEQPCPRCGGLMKRDGRFRVCTNEGCKECQPICPDCGAVMVKRKGPHGSFWGCLNYKTGVDSPCTHKENKIAFPKKS